MKSETLACLMRKTCSTARRHLANALPVNVICKSNNRKARGGEETEKRQRWFSSSLLGSNVVNFLMWVCQCNDFRFWRHSIRINCNIDLPLTAEDRRKVGSEYFEKIKRNRCIDVKKEHWIDFRKSTFYWLCQKWGKSRHKADRLK